MVTMGFFQPSLPLEKVFIQILTRPSSGKKIFTFSTKSDKRVSVVVGASYFTVKFLNFGTPENFAVIYLKFKQKKPNLRVFRQKDANGIANSEDSDQTAPDQTAPLGAV